MVATAQTTTPVEVSTIGRGIVIGAVSGWIAVTALATLLGLAGGMGLTSAFGFAACVSVWGGLGFGAMMGGTVAFTRDLDAQQHT
jgi:hypothetical protein